MGGRLKGKTVAGSMVEMTEMVLPQDTNSLGTIFGGTVVKWIDIAAAICARRHSGKNAVTASIDRLDFLSPVSLGDVVVIKARIVYAGRTSMVIAATVEREETATGRRSLTTRARLTFVAVDKKGRPTPVPPIILRSAEEKREYAGAEKKRKLRGGRN